MKRKSREKVLNDICRKRRKINVKTRIKTRKNVEIYVKNKKKGKENIK